MSLNDGTPTYRNDDLLAVGRELTRLTEENACFRELLERVIDDDFQLAHPGLSENIAHALGLIESWRCECGDINRYCDVFCYRCGAGKPEDEE